MSSRVTRSVLAILAAVSLLGLGHAIDDIRVPEPIARFFAAPPAASQPAATATPTATEQPAVTTTPPAVTASPISAAPDATATAVVKPTLISPTTTAQPTTSPTATSTVMSTVELVGPTTFHINRGDPKLEVWLTTSEGSLSHVMADILGLKLKSDGAFWPVHLQAHQPVTVTAGTMVKLTLVPEDPTSLPPFGTYSGTLRFNVATGQPVSRSVTLKIVPSNGAAELLADIASPVYVGRDEPLELVVAARYADANNVRARVTKLLNTAFESLPVGFIAASQPVTLTVGHPQVLRLPVDGDGLRRTLHTGVYTATLLLTADNAAAVTRQVQLQVPEPDMHWRLETPRVTPRFDDTGHTVIFDLLFTPGGGAEASIGATAAQSPDLNLVTLADGNGRSILPDTSQVDAKAVAVTQAGRQAPLQVGRRFRLTFAPEPLPHGVYTGTVNLVMGDAIQPVTFTLVVPDRDVTLSLPTANGTPSLKLGFTRLIPGVAWLWPRGPATLLLAPEAGFSRLANVAIPPANLVRDKGGLGQVAFEPVIGGEAAASPADVAGLPVQVAVRGIRYTGVYTGTTEIRSPDLASPKSLGVTVTVTDFIVWPIILIFLVVWLSACIAGRLDPEKNPDYQRLRNEELRQETIRLHERDLSEEIVRSTVGTAGEDEWYKDVKNIVNSTDGLLNKANGYVEARRLEDAKTARQKAEQELEKLRSLAKICRLWQRIEREMPGQSGQQDEYTKLQTLLREAWNLIIDADLDAAAAKISDVRGKLKTAKVAAETALEEEKRATEMKPRAPTSIQGWVDQVLGQAQGKRDAGRFGEALFDYRSASQGMMLLADKEPEEYSVQCVSPKEEYWVAGEELRFAVYQGGQLGPQEAKYEWYANDQRLEDCDTRSCPYIVPIAELGACNDKPLRLTICVKITLPGSNQQEADCQVQIKKPAFRIGTVEPEPVAERRVHFQLERQSEHGFVPVQDSGLHCDWTVRKGVREQARRGSLLTQKPNHGTNFSLVFDEHGDYTLDCKVKVAETGVEIASIKQTKEIGPSPLDVARQAYRRNQLLASVGTAAIASLAGVAYVVFATKTFGTLQDYVLAFLWGAGVDQASRGMPGTVTPVFQRFTNWLRGTTPQKENGSQEPPSSADRGDQAPGDDK